MKNDATVTYTAQIFSEAAHRKKHCPRNYNESIQISNLQNSLSEVVYLYIRNLCDYFADEIELQIFYLNVFL